MMQPPNLVVASTQSNDIPFIAWSVSVCDQKLGQHTYTWYKSCTCMYDVCTYNTMYVCPNLPINIYFALESMWIGNTTPMDFEGS